MSENLKNKPEITSEEWVWLDLVIEKIKKLQDGSVEITVHDSHVTRVEKTERVHLNKNIHCDSNRKSTP